VPAPTAFEDEDSRGGGGRAAGRLDPDAMGELQRLPADFRLYN